MIPIRIDKQKNLAVLHDTKGAGNLIPHAKRVTRNGRDYLIVHAGKEELQVLRNLGYDTPTPLSINYDWAGNVPFEAQIHTTDMLIHSPRAYVLSDMGCVDSETEYLTSSGWKKFGDGYSRGKVAQYHPESGKMEFIKPKKFVKLPCPEMIRIKNTRGLDQLLSPEHGVLLHSKAKGRTKREVVPAEDLLRRAQSWESKNFAPRDSSRISFSQAAIPTVFTHDNATCLVDDEDIIRVMVAVIADGHFPRKTTTRCIVRIKKERKQYRLRLLLTRAGIEFTEHACAPEGFLSFTFPAPWREKIFGSAWWKCNAFERLIIADEVTHWDYNAKGVKHRFSSSRKESADFIQYVFTSLGYTTSLRSVTRYRRGREEIEHTVIPHDTSHVGIHGISADKSRRPNMSIAPSTDGFKYCFMVPSGFLVLRRNGYIFCTKNTGKSLSALFAYDYLRKHNLVRKMLVVAPLSTLTMVWQREVFERMNHLTTVNLWHRTKQGRLKQLEEEGDIYIINHNGPGVILDELMARPDFDVVVIDELALFRNKQTDLWRHANAICQGRKFVWGMTGSPTPKSPADAWAQVKLLTPDRVPKYYKQFRDRTMTQISQFRWIPKQDANDKVFEVMQPAVRFTRDDCVDLPPTTYSTREVSLSKDQAKAYKEMVRHEYTEWLEGRVTAVNEGVKVAKLLQIACGFVYTEDRVPVDLKPTARLTELESVLDGTVNKVIVFVPFVFGVDFVHAYLEEAGFSVGKIYGDTPVNERTKIFTELQHGIKMKVLVAHPQCMAHGVTLTAADTIVWYAPHQSLEIYEQANARIPRPGQKNHTHIIHLESTAIERKTYSRLKKRATTQGLLLDMFKDNEGGGVWKTAMGI